MKVGDSAKTDYRFKVIVSARVKPRVINKELWPFSPPTGILKFDLLTKSKVVLGTQTVNHSFFVDGDITVATVTFTGFTEFDMARLELVEVSWVYSR